jgi:succinoglycan biosynthesis transport protein ExoP
VIAIAFTAGDPQLAADVANAVATEYVALQAAAARDMAEEAMSRMQVEIVRLRKAVAAAEAKVEAYRAGVARLSDTPPAADVARQNRAKVQLTADLGKIESEAARQRELLDTYVRRYRDAIARRQSSFLPVGARILSQASAPLAPSFPRKGPITAVVGALALLVMLILVAIRALARGRQRDRAGLVPLPEVADGRRTGVGARWNDDDGVRRILPGMPTFADTESDPHLREAVAALARQLIGEEVRRIMVVTAGDEIDKCRPLAAVALARALARADRRPVLIDLRDDGADSLSMGEAADLPGFSDLFAGEASFGQVIFRDRKSRVHFIPAGLGQLPRQNLADERIGLLVSALDHTYDHVVFDVAGDRVALIGAECDAVVVATAFRDSGRTGVLVERVQAHSQARIIVFQIAARAGEPPELEFGKAVGEAAA